VKLPAKLLDKASPRLRAYEARAALLEPDDRLESAFIATGLGVFSSQSMIDIYSAIYDSTDQSDLPTTDAWRLRQAFVGKTRDDKMAGIRHFLKMDGSDLKKEGARAAVARAASLIEPDAELEGDAADLIGAMLAAGYDRQAARWLAVIDDMDDANADACWAMLALAAPDGVDIDLTSSRVNGFIKRDQSKDKVRSALLIGGLAGLGRMSQDASNSLNRSNGFGLGRDTRWTRMIDAAAQRRQPATVLLLAGTGFQTTDWKEVPAHHLYHSVAGLKRTGQEYIARMIAAEALSRT
jgi:hypothetical protein